MRALTAEQTELAEVMGRAAATYDRVGPRFFAEIATRLVSRVDLRSLDRVLDVGTGPGVVLAELTRHVGSETQLVGVDFSADMIREAKQRLAAIGRPDAEFIEMDAGRLAFPTSSFDAVFCSAALYQLPNPGHAVGEFHRVLRSGGVLAISIFGAEDSRWDGKNELFTRLAPPLPRVGAGLKKADLIPLLARAGFERPQIEVAHLDVVFADADSWLENAWSHGERRALDAMEPAALEAFRSALPAALAPALEDDGALHWRPELILALAFKPV